MHFFLLLYFILLTFLLQKSVKKQNTFNWFLLAHCTLGFTNLITNDNILFNFVRKVFETINIEIIVQIKRDNI